MTGLKALDFFAGSGLVTEGLWPYFKTIWANDISPKKCAVYEANFGSTSVVCRSISEVDGRMLPGADMAWASFPCQDLSLAGNMKGLHAGTRSGLYWEWLRVIDEMVPAKRPPILCAENVVGFLVAENGGQFKLAYEALRARGYKAGAVTIDAATFLPQSRARSFLVGIREDFRVNDLSVFSTGPLPHCHSKAVLTAWHAVADPHWIWWRLPTPPPRWLSLADIIEWDAEFHPLEVTQKLMSLLSPESSRKVDKLAQSGIRIVGMGYKRVREEARGRCQRFEVRFDGLAGCLRMPTGGSSRQIVVLIENGRVRTRLLTVREAARLMGAPEGYLVPGSYNDAYGAMADAVAVPVTRWLAEKLLSRLFRPFQGVQDNEPFYSWPLSKSDSGVPRRKGTRVQRETCHDSFRYPQGFGGRCSP
jgi:DNA (cytosine-5)-methyltransferase 1